MNFWKTNRQNLLSQPPPDHPYFEKAYLFMKSWIEGESSFSLTTSGSTGVPKVITIPRKRLEASARLTGTTLGIGAGTTALVCLNINFIAGVMMLVRGMELNWELTIVEPSSNPLRLTEESSFDFIAMAPMQLASILSDEITTDKLATVGKILLGGAPVSASLLKQIEKLNSEVYLSYGMTETVSHVALRRLNGVGASEEFKALDEVVLGTDRRGSLWVSGPMTDGEVIQTNDLVNLGRADSIINSGGVKIQLEKIDNVTEQVLDELSYTFQFFNWYELDEKLGQKLILIIRENDADFDVNRLIGAISKRVSAYEVPKHVYFAGEFELTASGKVDKIATCKKLNIPQ
jgi:O-succinylbenzoic acid--CoA ligase